MDSISRFLINSFRQPAPTKVASVDIPELTAVEKRAYLRAMAESTDEGFLQQFEGSPLYPQAIALCEQELAMEQRQLQQRMAEQAQNSMRDYGAECNERQAMELQKKQLLLQLHKMKVMAPAPTQPGDAIIGEPQPTAQLGAELGGGTAGGAPVQEPAPGAAKMAALRKFAQALRTKRADVTEDKAQYLPGMLFGTLGGGYVGARRGAMTDRPIEGAVRGLGGGFIGQVAGGALGGIPGQLAHAAGHEEVALPLMLAGQILGGGLGSTHGAHLATRGMIPKEKQPASEKQASLTDIIMRG